MKKLISILLLLAVIAPGLHAQVPAKNIALSIQNGKFTINKINLSDKWLTAPAIKVLGVAPRQKDGFNKTHTYDKYGIVVFEKKADNTPSGKLSEFQVYFSELDEASTVSATGYFSGSFNIGSIKLSKNITADDLRAKLEQDGYTESDSYMPHNFRFAKDGLYIYFLFDEIEQRLIKVSVGKDVDAVKTE
jgi:hypothetical protein